MVSTISEWGSERAFEKLQAGEGARPVQVRRKGRICEIPSEELVVGDILLLSSGCIVPADLTMLEGKIWVDQSALNGENLEVEKASTSYESSWDLGHTGQVFCGSVICAGQGVARVSRVGKDTFYGTLAKELQTETRVSPLKLRLSHLAKQISRIGYLMAALVAVAYLFNAFFLTFGFDMSATLAALGNKKYLFETLLQTVTLVITIIVVAVPEGLPMMITVVLSSNMRRMLKSNVLVRKMVGIETAGSLNILFTDKTGTLTTGKMSVVGVLTGSGVYYRGIRALQAAPPIKTVLCENAMWNTESIWNGREAKGGNATDRALLTYFYERGTPEPHILSRIPFDSTKKMAAIRTKERAYIKGAPDVLLPYVVSYMTPDGQEMRMETRERTALLNAVYQHAKGGERLLMVCVSSMWSPSLAEMPLTLVGVIFLRDRVRREAYEAVTTLRHAGVQVVMVTGDGKETAAAIAKETGILDEDIGISLLSGKEMASLSDAELKEVLPHIRVIWRALPSDKSRLVRVAQEMGLVTGMTGDGVNDAPALKMADVGFAMGSGTDIAKEAGDIVILDDHIASICKTVLFGRTIFKSIRKFITFQLTMNLCAVGVSLLGQLIGIESPVTIIQMLWVNMIMDTLGGLAFAGEAPMQFYMKEKPKKREEAILSPSMLHQIFLTGAYTLGIGILFLASPFMRERFSQGGDETYFLTLFFALFIFSGIVNSFCARSERMRLFHGIGRNPGFLFIMCVTICVQVVMIYFGGSLFRTTPVEPMDLFCIIGFSLTIIPFDFLRRLFYRLGKKT